MKRANTMSTITVELTIKVKTKFTSSNAEKTNGFISRMSEIFTDAVLRFLKFSVSVALTRRLRYLRFLRFSVYYAIHKMNCSFEFFEVFSFNRTEQGV